MGKRSDGFERSPRGFYSTPVGAVAPLLWNLPDAARIRGGVRFDDPCAGDGALAEHLGAAGHSLALASDIHPMADGIAEMDALSLRRCSGDVFITNPPWPEPARRGEPTLAILIHLSGLAPTWLLLPADFAHNVYFGRVEGWCRKIVSVGRVKWIQSTPHVGKDNAAWYLFDAAYSGPTLFHGRSDGR
jgi:hypothetical protein